MSADTETADYATGDLLGGRFQVKALLGRGGFGETYAARDTVAGGEVAVKVLLLQRLKDWKALELFEREARVLASLDHPRVPDYVDFIQDETSGRAYLVQELAPGRPLGALLAEGKRFNEDEAIAIAEQVLEVLAYLQSLRPQVVHRDLKPDNLLYADGQIYVVDFGAVREVARQSGEGSTVAGTFGYMAPEQLMGRATSASDIFGLGMTLIHMLTGLAPDRLEQRRGKPDFRPRAPISDWFADLIDAMTEIIVDDRVASASRCLALLHARGTPIEEELTPIQAARMAEMAQHQADAEARRLAKAEEQKEQAALARAAADGEALRLSGAGQSLRVDYRPPLRRIASQADDPASFWTWTAIALLAPVGAAFIIVALVRSASTPGIASAIIALGILAASIYIACVLAAFFIMDLHVPRRITLEIDGLQYRLRRTLGLPRSGPLKELQVVLEEPREDKSFGSVLFSSAGVLPFEGKHITADELDELETFLTEQRVPVRRPRRS